MDTIRSAPNIGSKPSNLTSLPLSIRQRIYAHLLDASITSTPRGIDHEDLKFCTHRAWNLYPQIMRTNKQIYGETRTFLGERNRFVVIQRDALQLHFRKEKKLCLKPGPNTSPDLEVMVWPGKRGTKVLDVPGELMRIRFVAEDVKGDNKDKKGCQTDFYVILESELRDFCLALSVFYNTTKSTYCLDGLVAHITVHPPHTSSVPETFREKKARENTLLRPLAHLRFLHSVHVIGVSDGRASHLRAQMTRRKFDAGADVLAVNDELKREADQCRREGDFVMAIRLIVHSHTRISFFHYRAEETERFAKRNESIMKTGKHVNCTNDIRNSGGGGWGFKFSHRADKVAAVISLNCMRSLTFLELAESVPVSWHAYRDFVMSGGSLKSVAIRESCTNRSDTPALLRLRVSYLQAAEDWAKRGLTAVQEYIHREVRHSRPSPSQRDKKEPDELVFRHTGKASQATDGRLKAEEVGRLLCYRALALLAMTSRLSEVKRNRATRREQGMDFGVGNVGIGNVAIGMLVLREHNRMDVVQEIGKLAVRMLSFGAPVKERSIELELVLGLVEAKPPARVLKKIKK